MGRMVDDFFVGDFRYSEHASEYADVTVLKNYQDGKTEFSPDSEKEAAFICNVVELMSELRYKAEDKYRAGKTRALNRKGELLLDIQDIAEKLTISDAINPPEQLVSVIASKHYSTIETLIFSLRKVLERKRHFVPISEVQQVDSQCLRWLARQPGRYAAEKAGVRQKILAVVRDESRNTLENRVLKDFSYRTEIIARRYLQQNERLYPESIRIKEVKRLRGCLSQALKTEEMKLLPLLRSGVQPNYVLLHDSRYNKIWELYRLILAHARMTELVWAKRHLLFAEMFCTILVTRLHLEYNRCFDSSFWIRIMPENGMFFVHAVFSNVYLTTQNELISLTVTRDFGSVELCKGKYKKRIKLIFIPAYYNDGIQIPDNDFIYVVCCFSDVCCSKSVYRENVVWVKSAIEIDAVVSKLMSEF